MTLNDYLKVSLAYVVIATSDVLEIIYDTSTETETANNKSRDSFQCDTTVDDLGDMSRSRLFHIKVSRKRCVRRQSYYRLLTGNHTLAFDWCHFWWLLVFDKLQHLSPAVEHGALMRGNWHIHCEDATERHRTNQRTNYQQTGPITIPADGDKNLLLFYDVNGNCTMQKSILYLSHINRATL